jgi:hypothetical protein
VFCRARILKGNRVEVSDVRLSQSVVLSLAVVLGGWIPSAQEPTVNPDAKVLLDFTRRVDEYTKLHQKMEGDAPDLDETEDPSKIVDAQQALAAKIRAARSDAKPGDIFTPAIRAVFVGLMYPALKGPDGKDTKAAIKEDAPPAGKVPLQVNGAYPQTQPLSTVPPDLLVRLPQLPEHLEYRVVGRHLILRDVHANLIVDYMTNVIR